MKTLVIETASIINNLHAIREKADGAGIIADLSANAYGIGLIEAATVLHDNGIDTFAVSDPSDAAALRNAGFRDCHLMMLRSTADADELSALIDMGVICTVGSNEAAVALNGLAEARRTVVEVQIKLDTGFGRYGFSISELDKVAAIYRYMPSLAVVGTFSTYAASWCSPKFTAQQLETFSDALDKLNEMGLETGIAHICDGAALFKYDLEHMDAVRVGCALSGRIPGKEIPELERVGHIDAGIEEISWFVKGRRIGGENGVVTKRPTKVAAISVGYYNGFGVDTEIKQRGILSLFRPKRRPYVTINGRKAKVIGDVGMLHTLVDVTNINCTVGDIAQMDVDPVNVKGLSITYK
ncbi:MAG: alanine racemase [Oscillospiraceae bacterium]|nr:alanine racemase [Oscillospiraceae bacterium]